MRYWFMPFFLVATVIGCQKAGVTPPQATTEKPAPKEKATEKDEVAEERAKLSPDDRKLVEAQEWCVVSDDERLGSMGAPIKLMIKETPVFVCCKGCKKKAESDPDKTLAKLAELKVKKAVGKPVSQDANKTPKDGKHDHDAPAPKGGGHDHGNADAKGGHDHGMGGMMMGGPGMMQDMMGIRSLFAVRDKITRQVTVLKNGIETVTESDDPKIAEQIRQHVATMYKRIEDGKPLMMMSHQPVFGELIKHAKHIQFKSEKTAKGIKVIETSDDPYVAKLLHTHAELVTKFIKEGMETMMKPLPLPEKEKPKTDPPKEK